jgi:hypothetical protein
VKYYVGLDLGQSADYTALAIVAKVREKDTNPTTGKTDTVDNLHLVWLKRFPLGTLYPDIVDGVQQMVTGPPFNQDHYDPRTGRVGRPSLELLVDRTGVGKPVLDELRKRNLRFVGIYFGGDQQQQVHSNGRWDYTVPKRDLVASLEVAHHRALQDDPVGGKLKVAEGLDLWPVLKEELLKFRRKQNKKTGNMTYEHWRESDHDDLVLAAAMCTWKAGYQRKGTTKLRVIR